MPLTGQAKTDYQREYMRKRRSNQRSNVTHESVRPKALDPVRLYEPEYERPKPGRRTRPEPQSHNPMMVGYVPPTE